jgi:hypothetical protein
MQKKFSVKCWVEFRNGNAPNIRGLIKHSKGSARLEVEGPPAKVKNTCQQFNPQYNFRDHAIVAITKIFMEGTKPSVEILSDIFQMMNYS